MEEESQRLFDQSVPLAQRVSERLARFQANIEAARAEIEDLYERYTGLGVPLTGEDFEKQVLRVVRGMGFVAERTQTTADGGVDIIARRAEPLLRGKNVIQCKNWSKPVGVRVVRELYGVVMHEGASKGILITTSRFTDDAVEFAAGKPLELIDGDGWRELVTGMTVAPAEEVTERGNDLVGRAELLREVAQLSKLVTSKTGLCIIRLSEVLRSLLERPLFGRPEGYLSILETWAQETVSIVKELIVVCSPAEAECRALYGEIVQAFCIGSMHTLEEVASVFRIGDDNIVVREDWEPDAALAFIESMTGASDRLRVFLDDKTAEARDLMEKEGKGPSVEVELEEVTQARLTPRARPSKALGGTVVAVLVVVGIAVIMMLAFVLREGALPSLGPSSYPTPAPSPTFTPHPISTERPAVILTATATVSPPSPTPIVHVVQPGDTVSSIAALYGTSAQAICALNELADCRLITPGQELMIPGEGIVGPSPTERAPTPSPTALPTATPIPPTPVPYRAWRDKMTSAMAQAEAWIVQIDSEIITNYEEQSSCPLAEQINDSAISVSVDLFMAEQPDSWNCTRAEEEVSRGLTDIGVATQSMLGYCRYGDSIKLTVASDSLTRAQEHLSSARHYYDMCIAE